MIRDETIQIFGKKYSLKSLQKMYQKIIDENFSGRRGIVDCEFIGESVIFKVRYIFELLKVLTNVSFFSRDLYIVDIGCERGDMLLFLQRLGFRKLCGLNLTPYNPRWLAEGKKFKDFFGDETYKIKYLVCDIENSRLPLENGDASVVILSDVIEHMSNPGWVLSETNRIMVDNGLMVLGTPNIASIRNRLYLLFGRSINGDLKSWLSRKFRLNGRYVGHFREYTREELKYIARIYGFEPIRCRFVPTLTLLGKDRENISSTLFKIYSFFEKIWPGGRHRIVVVSRKFEKSIDTEWIPIPKNISDCGLV